MMMMSMEKIEKISKEIDDFDLSKEKIANARYITEVYDQLARITDDQILDKNLDLDPYYLMQKQFKLPDRSEFFAICYWARDGWRLTKNGKLWISYRMKNTNNSVLADGIEFIHNYLMDHRKEMLKGILNVISEWEGKYDQKMSNDEKKAYVVTILNQFQFLKGFYKRDE